MFGNSEEVQVCIEVITAYLRTPLSDTAIETSPQEISVKQAGYAILRAHLQPGDRSWGTRQIDLSGAHIDFRVSLAGAAISRSGFLSFGGANISGLLSIPDLTISDRGALSLRGATIRVSGAVLLASATIKDRGSVSLDNAAIRNHASVSLFGTKVHDRCAITLYGATIRDGGAVLLEGATLSGDAQERLTGAMINDNGPAILPDGRHLTPAL